MQAETLELLEWNRLCLHLSTFTTTKLGAIAAVHLPIPDRYDETLELLTQTKEIDAGAVNHLGYNMEEQIKDIMAKSFLVEREKLLDETSLESLGVDSLGVFEMVINIEDEFSEISIINSFTPFGMHSPRSSNLLASSMEIRLPSQYATGNASA
jgi:DNA mismatch repair protein MutS2